MGNILKAAKFIIPIWVLLQPRLTMTGMNCASGLFISCQSTMGQLENTVVLGIYRTDDGFEQDRVTANLSRSYHDQPYFSQSLHCSSLAGLLLGKGIYGY